MAWWLRAVPWSMIISNAPALVEGARKLLDKRHASDIGESARGDETVVQRLAALEGRERKMLELIESLAQGNQQLIVAVDVLQRRLRIGLGVVIALSIGLLVALVRSFAG